MGIYLGVIISSCFLLWVAETQHMRYSLTRRTVIVIALLIPITIAGLRKIGIGTDTNVYVNLMYEAASNSRSLIDYYNYSVFQVYHYVQINRWEIGFTTLVYAVTKIFQSYQAVLFAVEAVIIVFVYKGIAYLKKEIPVWFGMLVFYLMFYNATFNVMRQWIAMSILFFGYRYLIENKNAKYIITILASMLFHTSALIGIVVFFLYKYSNNGKERRHFKSLKIDNDLYKVFSVLAIGIIGLAALQTLSGMLSLLGASFSRYVLVYLRGSVSMMPMQIIRRLPFVFIVLLNWKRLQRENSRVAFYVICSVVMDILISQLGSITDQSGRMAPYFSIYSLILYPYILRANRKYRFIMGMGMVLILTMLWFYDYVMNGRGETVPYLFYFQ